MLLAIEITTASFKEPQHGIPCLLTSIPLYVEVSRRTSFTTGAILLRTNTPDFALTDYERYV